MSNLIPRWHGWLGGGQEHKYAPLDGPKNGARAGLDQSRRKTKTLGLFVMMALFAALAFVAMSGCTLATTSNYGHVHSCDTIYSGYQCKPSISHFWGQYSPYFRVPSRISDDIPRSCEITFAQVLSRHGERDPTSTKTISYNATIQKIQANVREFKGPYAFLSDYEYSLGADQLTAFGQQSMVNSGIKFYQRYTWLARNNTPFVRSSGEDRVYESAQNWTMGFHAAKLDDRRSAHQDPAYPYAILSIPETDGTNNTLNHGLCTAFESDGTLSSAATHTWEKIFLPPIQARLNAGLPGADLTREETIHVMDLCPFDTVASPQGLISPFCNLFSEREWHEYAYYETLGKYYGYGPGNPLGPTQGVGFVNELIARLTRQPVHDSTSSNRTLDSDPTTFPLDRALYADFSHDNDMTSIMAALGLYHSSGPLDPEVLTEARDAEGYSSAWTVPFAARVYVEKMRCGGHRRGRGHGQRNGHGDGDEHGSGDDEEEDEEFIRVLVNDRVQPLHHCGGDHLGRCTLSRFVESLGFARKGGEWDKCFV